MTSPRKSHATSAAAAAASSHTAAASSSDAAATAAAASSGTRSTRASASPPAPAAPSSQLLSPTTPFSSQSSLPPTPSSQGGGGSSRAQHEGGSISVDPSGFSNLQYLFGSNSALWDEDDEDDEEFVPNATDMADPDGLAGLEGIEEEMEAEAEEATPREAASRAESPASSQGGGGGSQRVGRASNIARRTRAHMPLHGVRLEDLESHLTSSVLDWDTANARSSDMPASSLLSPNPHANPLASPLPPRSPAQETAANHGSSASHNNGRHPELPAGMIDHSASTPSLTPGGADQDREYQNFLRLLAGGGDGGANASGDGAPDDDDDDDEEFQPGDAGMAEEEAEEEEYRNDRSVSISKKELRSLRNDSGEPLSLPTTAAAATSSRAMSTRRKEQQQQQQKQQQAHSSSSAAAAAHHPQTRSAAGTSAAHLTPPAPTTRSRQKGSSSQQQQQQQQPDFFASAHSSIPSQAALHTRRKPSQNDTHQSSQSYTAEQMEDTQPQPSQSDGSAHSAASDLYLTVPPLPPLPNFSFAGFSDDNPLANPSPDSAVAGAAVPLMPSTAAGLAQLTPLLQMLQQSIAALTAAPAVALALMAPPLPKPAVLPRADFNDAQRLTLVSQLNEHTQLLVQVRYLSLNSVLTPLPRATSAKKTKAAAAEEEADPTAAAASAAPAEVDPPPMSLKQLWDKSGDLLTELWQKREASLEKHRVTSAAAATIPSGPSDMILSDPFECPAPTSLLSTLPKRPLLSLVPLLDVWKGLSEGPELQFTHAEMVRQQEKHIPEPVKKQANKCIDAASRARIKAEIEAAEAAASSADNAAEASANSGVGSRLRKAYTRHGWCYTALLRRFLRAEAAISQIRPRLLPAIQMIYRKPLWTPAEDALLDRGYRAFGGLKAATDSGVAAGKAAPDWPRIKHRFLPARSVREIRSRFSNLRTSKVHPFNSATDSPFQKHLLRAELTEQEIEEQLAEDLLDEDAYEEKKLQEQQSADERQALLRHLREEELEETHPLFGSLQSNLHSSLFEEPEAETSVAAAAVAAIPAAPTTPARRSPVFVAEAVASPSVGAASAANPFLAHIAAAPAPAASSKKRKSASSAASLPPVFAPAVPIWSTKAVGVPGCLMRELTAEDTKLLKIGLDYFPETHPTRWSSIVAHFLPHWDRLSLRRAWLRMLRMEKLALEGKTIGVHKPRLSKKHLKQLQANASFNAQLQANAQMSAAAFAQFAAEPSALLAAYQRKSLAVSVPASHAADAVIDMTVGFEANKRQKPDPAAATTAASAASAATPGADGHAHAALMANLMTINAPSLLAPLQTLPASSWNPPAAAASASRTDQAASAAPSHEAPTAAAATTAAAAASAAEPVFEELDLELEDDEAAPAQAAAPSAAVDEEEEEVVEEESGVVGVSGSAQKFSAQQIAAAALAATAAAASSTGVAPMQLDGDDTDSETSKTKATAAPVTAVTAAAVVQVTPAKSPSKRILARSAADAIIALRAPDESASSLSHTRAAAATAASPAKPSAFAAASRSHSSPEKRTGPAVAFATPRATPLRTPQKSGLASLAHTSELIHTVPAPLLAPVDKQLQYSEESLAYASSTPLPSTSSPSKLSRASSRHATPLVMVVTPAPEEGGPATRSIRRTRSPLVAANAAAAVAAATAAASASSSFAPHQLLSSLSAAASPSASRPPRAARALAQASLTAAASGRWGVGDRGKASAAQGLPQAQLQRAISDPPPASAAAAAAAPAATATSSISAASASSPATTVPSTPIIATSSSSSDAAAAAAPSWTDAEDRSILTAAKSFGLEVQKWPAETLQPLLQADTRRTEVLLQQRLMSFLTAMVQKLPDA